MEEKVIFNSTRRGLKFARQMTIFIGIIFFISSIFFMKMTYEKVHEYQVRVQTFSQSFPLLSSFKPDLFDLTELTIVPGFWAIVSVFVFVMLLYLYRVAVQMAKNFIEIDLKTRAIRMVRHKIFNRSEEEHQVFDSLIAVRVIDKIYSKKLNFGELILSTQYSTAGQVYTKNWMLDYCDNPTLSVDKIKNLIRQQNVNSEIKLNINDKVCD
jgi:hypothetical protein